MDSLEINKAVAAFLMAGIAFMGAQLISEALVHPTPIKGTAIKVDLPGEQTAAAVPAEAEPPIATRRVAPFCWTTSERARPMQASTSSAVKRIVDPAAA